MDSIKELIELDWVRFAAFTVGGVVLGLFLSGLVTALARRSKRKMISDTADRLRSIVLVVFIIFGLRFGLEAFDLEPNTWRLISQIFVVVVYTLVTWAVIRFYDVLHEQLLRPWGQNKENVAIVDVLRTFAVSIIWIIGILSALNSAGYSVSAVLAGLGIGGLALALAAQDAVANIFGGVIILTQNPFKVGDRIKIGGDDGWVQNIGLRATIIENWYGHRITVPNKSFTDSHVTNVDARSVYWESAYLKLRHDSSLEQIDRAVELVREVLEKADHLTETTWVGVCNIGEGYVEVEVWYGVEKYAGADDPFPNEYMKILAVKSTINMAILRVLEQESIHLSMPLERQIVSQEVGQLPQSRF